MVGTRLSMTRRTGLGPERGRTSGSGRERGGKKREEGVEEEKEDEKKEAQGEDVEIENKRRR